MSSYYNTGTVSVTNGATAVAGTGTSWAQTVYPGDMFIGPDGRSYTVASVEGDTGLTLVRPYAGGTEAGAAYEVLFTEGRNVSAAAALTELMARVGGMLDGAGAGRFQNGDAATPGVRSGEFPASGVYFGEELLGLTDGVRSVTLEDVANGIFPSLSVSGDFTFGGNIYSSGILELFTPESLIIRRDAKHEIILRADAGASAEYVSLGIRDNESVVRAGYNGTNACDLVFETAAPNGNEREVVRFDHLGDAIFGRDVSVSGTLTANNYDGNLDGRPVEQVFIARAELIPEDTEGDPRPMGVYRVDRPGSTATLLNFKGHGGSAPNVQIFATYGDELFFRVARDSEANFDSVGIFDQRIWHSGNFDLDQFGRTFVKNVTLSDPFLSAYSGTENIDLIRMSATGEMVGDAGFTIRYMGARSGLNNSFAIMADNGDGGSGVDQIEAMRINQGGDVIFDNTVTASAHNTGSDYRLKAVHGGISSAWNRVKALLPYEGHYLASPEVTAEFFLAHEAQEQMPYAVTGQKDDEQMQAMDYSKAVPLLTAALKEAMVRIEALEEKLEASA